MQNGVKMEIEWDGKNSLHNFEKPGNHSLTLDIKERDTITFNLNKSFLPQRKGGLRRYSHLGVKILSIK